MPRNGDATSSTLGSALDLHTDREKGILGGGVLVTHVLFSPDMKELLGLFERHDVNYVLVGGFAVNYYGYLMRTS